MIAREKSFVGKVALVTGGSKGIGTGIVRRLAAGDASVAFTYSSSEEKALQLVREIASAGGKVLSIKADSASAKELRAAVARTKEILDPLDIFVSNAGILTMGTIDAYSLEDFDRMVAINVRGAFVGIQAAAQEMKDGGRIVFRKAELSGYFLDIPAHTTDTVDWQTPHDFIPGFCNA
jgi:3-oxoacyl-[acyl-carrier protein] reductase